jgi:hypothetical protein
MRWPWFLLIAVTLIMGFVAITLRGGPGPSPDLRDGGPVNKAMARLFETAALSARDNPSLSRLQLEEAQRHDPDNGFIDLLFAMVAAHQGETGAVVEAIERAAAKPRFVQYMEMAPPMGAMPALPALRELGRSAKKAAGMPKAEALRYLDALSVAGAKIARSEPHNAVGFMVGAGTMVAAARERVGLLRIRGTPEEAKAAAERQAALLAWEAAGRERLRAQMQTEAGQDVMNRVADAAKLDGEDRAKFLGGEAISEAAQERVDAALFAMFEEEQRIVRELLETMPEP